MLLPGQDIGELDAPDVPVFHDRAGNLGVVEHYGPVLPGGDGVLDGETLGVLGLAVVVYGGGLEPLGVQAGETL